jgi:hypothetical protein
VVLDEPEKVLPKFLTAFRRTSGLSIFELWFCLNYEQFGIKPFLLIFCEQEILTQLLFLSVVRSDDDSNEKVENENGAYDDERDEEPKG